MTRGIPTPATRAVRRDPNVCSTFLIISFSYGLVRFGGEDYRGLRGLTSLFFTFFKIVLTEPPGLMSGRDRSKADFWPICKKTQPVGNKKGCFLCGLSRGDKRPPGTLKKPRPC